MMWLAPQFMIVLPFAVMLYLVLRLLFKPGQEMRFMLGLLLTAVIGLSYLCHELLSLNVDQPRALASTFAELVRQGNRLTVEDPQALADRLAAFDMKCQVWDKPQAGADGKVVYCLQQALVPMPGFDGMALALSFRDKRLAEISGGHNPKVSLVVDGR
jgi:hypothetical protein